MSTRLPAPGFSDQVRDAQQTFRALLDALGRPTTKVPLPSSAQAPGALTQGAAALLLTVADESTPLWLGASLAGDPDVATWVAFHLGAPLVEDPARAAFAVVADPAELPALGRFALGSDEAPHTSTTVVVAATTAGTRTTFGADGPGFREPATWAAPALPDGFAAQWQQNHAIFPRGVDVVFADDHTLVGLPRTTRLTEVD